MMIEIIDKKTKLIHNILCEIVGNPAIYSEHLKDELNELAEFCVEYREV